MIKVSPVSKMSGLSRLAIAIVTVLLAGSALTVISLRAIGSWHGLSPSTSAVGAHPSPDFRWGTVALLAGRTDSWGSWGDGGPAIRASLGKVSAVAVDALGNVFVTDNYIGARPNNSNCVVREIVAATGIIRTVAGSELGTAGDGIPALGARLAYCGGIAVDFAGNLFISDTSTGLVREISRETGTIKTVAGGGQTNQLGDGGQATMAHLHEPTGLAVDPRGTLFIADGGDNRIRKVDTTGIITTVAGSGLAGSAGDGGPANLGQLAQPRGVAVDGQGNIFVADTGNFLIRRIDAVSGILTTVAGNGKPARAVEGTIPVPHGLPATRAALEAPWAVALDSQGNLFIAHGVISEVVAVSGLIWTVAGSGRGPISREEIAAQMATIPANQAQTAAGGLALTSTGNIAIADTGNRLVRVLTLPK